ncbi:hypothetical protein, partial [Caulobacter sp. 17J65-9]|uniref:hypothetical protein n=1 Tax=Caulobacter sp. 17J65-9 TaxID=2709382 RepID=UPI001969EE5C
RARVAATAAAVRRDVLRMFLLLRWTALEGAFARSNDRSGAIHPRRRNFSAELGSAPSGLNVRFGW